MSDTLARRQASAGRGGRGRGGATPALSINLSQPAAFSAGALQHGRGGGAAPQPQQGLVGQPYLNTTAMMGMQQPTMVAARPSQEAQQQQNAQRVQQQLEAFGISALVAPDADEGEAQMRAHGFAEDQMVDGQLANFSPKRGLLKCYVVRTRLGVISTTQQFHMFVEGGDRFVLAGRKRANKQTSNFLLSRDANNLERDSQHFHGKVRANFSGTDFIIYNEGEGPEKAAGDSTLRRELGAILFETNIAGTKGPRKMTVVLPRPRPDGSAEVFQPRSDEESIVSQFRANQEDTQRFVVLVNKEPKWNEQLRSYQLNFHGRVSKASVKNFQLVERGNQGRTVMQFGKKDDDRFSCDFQAPLTSTLAFAIALATFDNKIACE